LQSPGVRGWRWPHGAPPPAPRAKAERREPRDQHDFAVLTAVPRGWPCVLPRSSPPLCGCSLFLRLRWDVLSDPAGARSIDNGTARPAPSPWQVHRGVQRGPPDRQPPLFSLVRHTLLHQVDKRQRKRRWVMLTLGKGFNGAVRGGQVLCERTGGEVWRKCSVRRTCRNDVAATRSGVSGGAAAAVGCRGVPV